MSDFEKQVREVRDTGEFFADENPIYIGRAPGRLDLMGGNGDYTGGLVFESTIREATYAAVQLSDDCRIRFLNPQMRQRGWSDRYTFNLNDLINDQSVRNITSPPDHRWTAYTLGCIYYLRSRYPENVRTGASIYIHSEVPLNKGVSSSASVEVAVMKPAAFAYGIELSGVELSEACQWAENVIAESACGIMDQIAVTMGDEGCVLPMICQPAIVEPLVRLPDALQVYAVDSGVSHEVSGIEYEAARAAAFMGYKLICDLENNPVTYDESGRIPRWTDPIWNGYLANLPPSSYRERYESALPDTLTGSEFLERAGTHVDPFTPVIPDHIYRIRANTRYAVEENHRVELFSEVARGATTERAFAAMGELMYQSHYAYTECGLGSAATDLLVSLARGEGAENGIYGAKITGGGAGGTVAFLGLKTASDAFGRIVDLYRQLRGIEPYVFEGSSIGATDSAYTYSIREECSLTKRTPNGKIHMGVPQFA